MNKLNSGDKVTLVSFYTNNKTKYGPNKAYPVYTVSRINGNIVTFNESPTARIIRSSHSQFVKVIYIK